MAPKFLIGPAVATVVAVAALAFFNQPAHGQQCQGWEMNCSGGWGAAAPTPVPPGSGSVESPQNEKCRDDSVALGEITATAAKTAPAFPLVTGQDDTKRGVDLACNVSVADTIVTSWSHNSKGKCVRHTEHYPEGLNWTKLSANLSPASREWILDGDLQIHYPGAYLHNPDMLLGACAGALNAQVADPGEFFLNVTGQTSGTAVHGPRNFNLRGGSFLAYLREVIITK